MKKSLIIILLLLCGACTSEKPGQLSTYSLSLGIAYNDLNEPIIPLNTVVNANIYQENNLVEIENDYNEIILKYHTLLDKNNNYLDESNKVINNLKVINDAYGTKNKVIVDESLFNVLISAMKISELAPDYFNIALGALNDLYAPLFSSLPFVNKDPLTANLNKAKACVPSFSELKEILVFDQAEHSILFNKLETCEDRVILDLGAYAKGYIGDVLKEKIKQYQQAFILDIGTSSILTYATPNDQKRDFKIGVRSPYNKQKAMFIIKLKDEMVLSTSGDDFKYYLLDDGTIRHHILNPTRGVSENYYRSVIVVANKKAGASDALSTILMNIEDPSERQRIIKSFEEAYDIQIEYALVKEIKDQLVDVIVSKNMKEYIIKESLSANINEIRVEE